MEAIMTVDVDFLSRKVHFIFGDFIIADTSDFEADTT
jgi:hypothetical protein